MCVILVASEGRRIDGLTRDAGIVGFFWVFERHTRYGGWDGAKRDAVEVHRTQLTYHQATEGSGDGGLPTNLQTSSEHVLFDLSSQKSSGRSSLPTWSNVVFSCLNWSTKTLHRAYSDRRNYCWPCQTLAEPAPAAALFDVK